MLPNFIIISERRCGTTSLYHWVNSHPDVFMYPLTDMNYFVEDEFGGRKWFDGNVDHDKWEQMHNKEDYSKLFMGGREYQAVGHKGADLFLEVSSRSHGTIFTQSKIYCNPA